MATWVDPFSGVAYDTSTPPLGDYHVIPEGTGYYAVEYSTGTQEVRFPAGGGDFHDYVQPGGYEADRGRMFYMPGDEYRILSAQGDLAGLQAALEAAGALSGDYLIGSPDAKTAAAMKKVLEAANAAGVGWEDILGRGLDGAAGSRGRGGGGGGGVAFITDDDVKALLNKASSGVLGRKLNGDEESALIGAFRGLYAGGTSPSTSAETAIRQGGPAGEAVAHDVGNVLSVIQQMLRGARWQRKRKSTRGWPTSATKSGAYTRPSRG